MNAPPTRQNTHPTNRNRTIPVPFWRAHACGPYNAREMAGQPGNGRRSGVCGGVKTPPYKAIQTPSNPWTGNAATFRGRHAAPAHGPNAVAAKKRYHGADVHGGVKTPPYKVKKTPCQPDSLRVLWRRKPNFRAAAGRGPHSFFIFIFSFFISPGFYFFPPLRKTDPRCAATAGVCVDSGVIRAARDHST